MYFFSKKSWFWLVKYSIEVEYWYIFPADYKKEEMLFSEDTANPLYSIGGINCNNC